ncbi:hypothetical protein HK100_007100 [Physocladia obscura]|uniref:Protein kinase domain-containing protein n=1 Tax=Physocladia obscura TaxID=109957 RepID=A0AAD5SPP6_9FUNG|nr:hypothetical protein HK100_007100 [Physocladia obscura]
MAESVTNATDLALAFGSLLGLTLPPPFDKLPKLIVAVVETCQQMRRNKTDAAELKKTAYNVARSLGNYHTNLSNGGDIGHANSLRDTLESIVAYLTPISVESQKSRSKMLFAAVNQAARTAEIKDKIAEFIARLTRDATFLTMEQVSDLPQRFDGLTNELVEIKDEIKALVKTLRSSDLMQTQKELYLQILNRLSILTAEHDLGNTTETDEVSDLVHKVHKHVKLPITETWMISVHDVKYSPDEKEIKIDDGEVRGHEFSIYKGLYIGHIALIKVFHNTETVKLHKLEKALTVDLRNWKKVSDLPYVHTLIGFAANNYPPIIVCEFCPLKITKYIHDHPRQLLRILHQLISGIISIHDRNILHCEISSNSIFITSSGDVAISDFGTSRCTEDEVSTSVNKPVTYSVNFQSPEYMTQSTETLTTVVDIWSFGIVGYALLTGNEPFAEYNNEKISDIVLQTREIPRIENIKVLESIFGVTLDALNALLQMCLVRDPERRISGKHIKEYLEAYYGNEIAVDAVPS